MGTDANERGYADEDGNHVEDEATIEQMVESGMVAQIERIKPYSDRTVILGDPPIHEISPVKCLTVRNPTLEGCLSPPEARSETMADATRRAAETAGAEFLVTRQWFCWDGVVPHRCRSTGDPPRRRARLDPVLRIPGPGDQAQARSLTQASGGFEARRLAPQPPSVVGSGGFEARRLAPQPSSIGMSGG